MLVPLPLFPLTSSGVKIFRSPGVAVAEVQAQAPALRCQGSGMASLQLKWGTWTRLRDVALEQQMGQWLPDS